MTLEKRKIQFCDPLSISSDCDDCSAEYGTLLWRGEKKCFEWSCLMNLYVSTVKLKLLTLLVTEKESFTSDWGLGWVSGTWGRFATGDWIVLGISWAVHFPCFPGLVFLFHIDVGGDGPKKSGHIWHMDTFNVCVMDFSLEQVCKCNVRQQNTLHIFLSIEKCLWPCLGELI